MSFLSVRPIGLSAAMFLVALFAAPRGSCEALAGCGDYVHLGQGEARQPMEAAPGDPSSGWLMPSGPRPPGPAPCHGPACRQNAPLPAAPIPLPPSTTTDQQAWLDARLETSLGGPQRILPDSVAIPDDVSAGRRDRPPRHGS